MHLKLKYALSEVLWRKTYFNEFSRSGVIGNQTPPSQCLHSFNALHCEGYGGAGRAHNALPTDCHRGAQFKFDFGCSHRSSNALSNALFSTEACSSLFSGHFISQYPILASVTRLM